MILGGLGPTLVLAAMPKPLFHGSRDAAAAAIARESRGLLWA